MKTRGSKLAAWLTLALLGACDSAFPRLALQPVAGGGRLEFSVVEERIHNVFVREGPVAAHLLMTSGSTPRLVVAFPAGNSGVGVWFRSGVDDVRWLAPENVRPVRHEAADGRVYYGIEALLSATASRHSVERVVLGSVRTLRDYGDSGRVPAAIENRRSVEGTRVTWQRTRLDGEAGYIMALEVLEGSLAEDEGTVTIAAPEGGRLRLVLRALSAESPLQPLAEDEILRAGAGDDRLSRQVLTYLSYREKFLAGSWRFLTYFGRDTLLALRLLMPVLTPEAVEAGLGSVIERIDAAGEVAHEEDIGEFAVLRHLAVNGTPDDAPLYDYTMIDDDFLLVPVLAHHLLAQPEARRRAFLARTTPADESYAAVLARHARFVIESARSFAHDPVVDNLISLKAGASVGNWRDSRSGLGGGRIPYDVNAVFVPAALDAVAALVHHGLLPREEGTDQAAAMAAVWRSRAPSFFPVRLSHDQARAAIGAYAAQQRIPGARAQAALGTGSLAFNAVALDAGGKAIPIMHSDDGFALLFSDPEPETLERAVDTMLRPFPAGLLTPVGLVVANPAFAPEALQHTFTRGHYHGTTIWSWQQALLAAGLERQLRRGDLPVSLRAKLLCAEERLWAAIDSGTAIRTAELWSWRYDGSGWHVVPFGQDSTHETESNAAQLWSTVYLAVGQERRGRKSRQVDCSEEIFQ